MPQESVEVVCEALRASSARDFDRALAHYAEDCVSEDIPELPDHTTYQGKEGLRHRYRNFTAMWGDLVWEPVEFIDAGGDVVVAVLAMHGHGKGSDAPFDAVCAFVYELHDGRIVRDRAFTSKRQALEAAGLAE